MNQQEIVKAFLLKYCDPKPQYDGITADELSKTLLELLNVEPTHQN